MNEAGKDPYPGSSNFTLKQYFFLFLLMLIVLSVSDILMCTCNFTCNQTGCIIKRSALPYLDTILGLVPNLLEIKDKIFISLQFLQRALGKLKSEANRTSCQAAARLRSFLFAKHPA